jgi:hypothetical protein
MPMRKRKAQAVPVLSAAGLLALTGSATAMTAVDHLSADAKANHLMLSEEEVSDVSLATFYVFDKERAAPPAFILARGCGRCGGGCARCAAGRCAAGRCAVGRCAVGRCAVGGCVVRRCAVGGCAGCGGGCGSYCLSMGGCDASC